MVADRQVPHESTEEPLWVGLSKSDAISGTKRNLVPISVSGLHFSIEKALMTWK
jgi:hypothetical protein